ncbi:MAG: pyridoxal-phosphate dependent enzyme [Actinomycetia bacterium]|nr:pyridoxal-phosphate dependent enzyme [Actinomycetes bacterium]MCP4960982.1 pyridoxal-phosphate dependent enzyme [Actinomycetes bacterium]
MDLEPIRFAGAPTPMQRCDDLAEAIGLERGQLYFKRDDLTAIAGGGNKARKLEYLCADAIGSGATTLVTGGAAQSNHVRMTAVAAAMTGLGCVAVLRGDPSGAPQGNLVLDNIAGAELVFTGDAYSDDLDDVIVDTAAATDGGYAIPLGGSTPVGCLGYVEAADEIDDQGPADSLVVHATGSGGTHAGLVAGFGDHARVTAVDVGAVREITPKVANLASQTAVLAGRRVPVGSPNVIEGFVGDGYGAKTDATRTAISLALRHAGVVLDPVYSGKAFGGLVHLAGEGRLGSDRPIVFVATGGSPVLFTERYATWVGKR